MKQKLTISLLVIVALLAAGVILTPPTIGQDSRNIYWTGQDVEIQESVEADSVYSIYNESGDNFIRQIRSDSNGELTIKSGVYGSGNYNIIEPTSGETVYRYTVVDQNFGVDADKNIAVNEVVEYELLSGRGEFTVNLTSENMNVDQLRDGLDLSSDRVTNIEDGVQISQAKSQEKILLDTTDINPGEYTLQWNVTDTIDTAETPLTTSDRFTGDAEFSRSVYSVNQGDSTEIQLDLSDTEFATVQIGRENYQYTVELRDSNDNGDVRFSFRTLEAGTGTEPVRALSGTVIEDQSDDVDLNGNILDPITYTMVARIGDKTTDTSILDVNEPEFNGINTYQLSSDINRTDYGQVTDNMVEGSSISDKEYVVVEVNTSSIYGTLPENPSGIDLSEIGILSNEFGGSLVIQEDNPDINREAQEYDLEDSDAVFARSDENRLLVVVDADDLPNIDKEDGDRYSDDALNTYEAEFTVDSDENPVFEDDIDAESQFSVNNTIMQPMNREITDSGDRKHILDIENPQINLSGNLADGRNITIISDTLNTNLTVFEEATVEDGQISFPVNESEVGLGDEFTVEIPTTGYEYDFIVGSSDLITNLNVPDNVTAGEEFDLSVDLRDDIPSEDLNVIWILDNSEYKTGRSITHSRNQTGTLDVTANVEGFGYQYLDFAEATVEITEIPPTPEPEIVSDRGMFLLEGDSITYTANVGNVTEEQRDDLVYEWRLNGETIDSESSSVTVEAGRSMNDISVSVSYGDNTGTASNSFYAYPSTQQSKAISDYYLG